MYQSHVKVEALNNEKLRAHKKWTLQYRKNKPYRYYDSVKGDDSRRYPKLAFVSILVQRANANYFGRYIEECSQGVSEQDFKVAAVALSWVWQDCNHEGVDPCRSL